MNRSKLVFRSSFPVLWRWTTLVSGGVAILVYIAAVLTGNPLPTTVVAVFSLFAGTVFGIAAFCFPVYVLTDGIRCYNYYGFYKTVPWSSPLSIRKESVFGLPYLAVGSTVGASEIYIPLYLFDMRGFTEAIRDRAGQQHPLCQALMKEHSPEFTEADDQQHRDSHE